MASHISAGWWLSVPKRGLTAGSHKAAVKDFHRETQLGHSQALEAVMLGRVPAGSSLLPKPSPAGAGWHPSQPGLTEAALTASAAFLPLMQGGKKQHCASLLERLPIPAARR